MFCLFFTDVSAVANGLAFEPMGFSVLLVLFHARRLCFDDEQLLRMRCPFSLLTQSYGAASGSRSAWDSVGQWLLFSDQQLASKQLLTFSYI